MITQRKTVIPIFDYRLTIAVFDDWDEISHFAQDDKGSAFGITVVYEGAALIAVKSDKEATIAHECEHVKNAIWDYIGYTPLIDNDEVDAYLLGYLYSKVKDVFNKHNKGLS